jgi:hypothetical protein
MTGPGAPRVMIGVGAGRGSGVGRLKLTWLNAGRLNASNSTGMNRVVFISLPLIILSGSLFSSNQKAGASSERCWVASYLSIATILICYEVGGKPLGG